ncbi:fibulin-5-like [Lethenteron reissneri]|uniref:fibulin-5-like n=1 Tax=Lethenteron reissneri TaxID=7753 RepID=UPI002AB697B2|nr:fibulin-5-like [Lethenteron reissneri]
MSTLSGVWFTTLSSTAVILVHGSVRNLTFTNRGVTNTSLEVTWLSALGAVEKYTALIAPIDSPSISINYNGSLTAKFAGLRPRVQYIVTVKTIGKGNVSDEGVSVTQSTDSDECSDGTSKCAQVCNELNLFENSQGYNCSCFGGFKMQQDGIRCQPIVSCTLACTNGKCFIDQITKRPTCSCNKGFALDQTQQNCLDINECEAKPCDQECTNLVGTYQCSCYPGYNVDPDAAYRCVDFHRT